MVYGCFLSVSGSQIVDGDGRSLALRGYNVGGWMNMENFLTGYPTTELQHREAMLGALGRNAIRYSSNISRMLSSATTMRNIWRRLA